MPVLIDIVVSENELAWSADNVHLVKNEVLFTLIY